MNFSSPTARDVDNATLEMLVSPVLTLALPVIYLLVFAISTPCNLVSFLLLCGLAKRNIPTVIFAINLSLADLLYSFFLPFQVVYHLRGNDWPFGAVACGISTAAFYCNMKCSVLTTCAIALERYCGVVHPLKTRHWRSPRNAAVACLLIWALVLTFEAPLLRHNLTLLVSQLNVTTCFDVLPRNIFHSMGMAYLYFGTEALLFNMVPLAVLVWCSCAVAHGLGQSPDAAACRARRHTQAVVAVAALCFIVCYLPNMVLHALHIVYHMRGKSLYAYYKLTLGLNSLNCCFDPFVYYLASRDFRQVLCRALGWCQCCPSSDGEEPVITKLSELVCAAKGTRNDTGVLLQR